MGQPNPHNLHPRDMIEVDPNAEKKLAEILKEALSYTVKPTRLRDKPREAAKGKVEPGLGLSQRGPDPVACEGDDPRYAERGDHDCDHHVESIEVAVHCSTL